MIGGPLDCLELEGKTAAKVLILHADWADGEVSVGKDVWHKYRQREPEVFAGSGLAEFHFVSSTDNSPL